jgi:hypothetical protein
LASKIEFEANGKGNAAKHLSLHSSKNPYLVVATRTGGWFMVVPFTHKRTHPTKQAN